VTQRDDGAGSTIDARAEQPPAGIPIAARVAPDTPGRATVRSYASAGAAIAAVTAIGIATFDQVTLTEIPMLYLLAIMLVSLLGRGPSLVAASLAVAAFDFCFVPPRFTFAIAEARYLLTFAVMFLCGLVISTLVVRLRRQQRDALTREIARLQYAGQARDAEVRARTEELRSSLLSAVSHDLRTPLAVITGAATSLVEHGDRLTPAARSDLLWSIVDDARRLERVLSNLLQLTRVESGLQPTREWVPAEEIIGAALTRTEEVRRGTAVETDVPSDLVLQIDPVLFEQVLINLLDNAMKHAAPPFAVRARRRAGDVEIEVADRGPGLPPGQPRRLFEKFIRGSTAPGAGLGLAVVRAIVQAHGGTVVAEPRAGGGAVFRIVLPTPVAAAASQLAAIAPVSP
jgi:two-component system sensor histidine kinase KdpD